MMRTPFRRDDPTKLRFCWENCDSPHQTPATIIYDSHWYQLRLVSRWNWERYIRLCQFLQHTPYELASLVMMKHSAVDAFRERNRLVSGHPKATALLLTLLEAHVMKAWTNDVIENPFPNLKTPSSAREYERPQAP
jgi:hypothetical protein